MYDFLDQNPKPKGYYDRVYSLGADCRSKQAMRFNYIGCKRGPLDWMMTYSMESLVLLLESDFKDFFLLENMVKYPDEYNPDRIFHDSHTNFTSRHDFPKNDKSLEELYPAFKEKLEAITEAFRQDLKTAAKTLFILHLEMEWDPVCTHEGAEKFIEWMPRLRTALEKYCGANQFELQIITFRNELLTLTDESTYVNIKPKEGLIPNLGHWMKDNEYVFWKDLFSEIKLNDPSLRKGYESIQASKVILESEKKMDKWSMLNKEYVFDEKCIAEYKEKGFVNVGKIFTDEFTDKLISDIDSEHSFKHQFADQDTAVTQSLYIWYKSLNAQALIASEELSQVACKLAECERLRLWHDQSQYKEPITGGPNITHQDVQFWPFMEPYTQLTAWIALDDAVIANGCMHMMAGSHTWGDATDVLTNVEHPQDFPTEYKGHKIEKEYIEVKKGEVHFHHHLTWHGSHKNESPMPRRAYILHLFADGTKFDEESPLAKYDQLKTGDLIERDINPLIGEGFVPLAEQEAAESTGGMSY